jgi:hypothetical protein
VKKLILIPLLLLGMVVAADAYTVAYTSFEEPVIPVNVNNVPASNYQDLGSAAVDHTLANTPGFVTPVVYTSVGGELGFTAYYTNSRGGTGLADAGGLNGVNNFANSAILAATDGTQRYLLSDLDGRVTVTLDSVDLTGAVDPRISLDFFFRSTSYESDDYGRIWLEIDDGGSVSEISLLDTRPSDIDDLNLEDFWTSVSAPLPSGTIATLKFEAENDSASEMLGVDNIRFTSVPEPASLYLVGLGLAIFGSLGGRRPQ